MMRVLDLFSGIGGFSLGLERTGGFKTVAFCEIDKFCQRVLAKHWPGVPIYDDIKELTGARLAADGIAVDVICGGFPCQDVSFAGKRAGLQGARSGLWSEYRRLIGELRPRFVLVENVPGLLSLGMGTVLGDLAALGFDAQWDCIPACAIGAPHRRDRVWLVGYTACCEHSPLNGSGPQRSSATASARPMDLSNAGGDPVADAKHIRLDEQSNARDIFLAAEPTRLGSFPSLRSSRGCEDVADANGRNGHGRGGTLQMGRERSEGETQDDGHAGRTQWSIEPDVGRVAHGVPNRVDRLRAIGNAVVPQIPELIGRAILEACHD